MNTLKVSLKDAEKTKVVLMKNGLLDNSRSIGKTKNFIFFPVVSASEAKKLISGAKLVKKALEKRKKITKLKGMVGKKLTKKELGMLKRAYDVIGTIAVMEIPRELEKKEKILARALLKLNKRIKTVVKKAGGHFGEFRVQKMKHLAGIKTQETIHGENGIRLKLNVETVYFSPRLSSERKRIAELVKKGEKVLVMFSGCGPYVCVIAKKSPAKEVVGVEINPSGHKYAQENLKLNKIGNARLYLGDVKKIVPELKEKFDRILMPLPKSAEDFLETALIAAKKETVIHFYDFLHETEIPHRAFYKIEKACKRNNLKCKMLNWVKCGQQAPRVYRICVDFEVV